MLDPVVVTAGETRAVSIRLALEHVVVTESRYGASEHGPEPHVHRLHADCFFVLEGTFTLSLPPGDVTLEPGTFALIPPNVVHAFRNDGPADVRFLNFHAPGVGFDRYVQEIGAAGEEFRVELAARFDQHPPPADGGADPASVVVRTGATDAVRVAGVHIGFLANASETLGAMGLVEYTAPPGFAGPPAHLHERTWDAYHVVEGSLDLRVGDDRLTLAAGDTAAVPPGTVHGFANPSPAPVRFLDIHAPGGFEDYFREVAAAVESGGRDPAVLAEIGSRYDIL